jgi:hypothetical protein
MKNIFKGEYILSKKSYEFFEHVCDKKIKLKYMYQIRIFFQVIVHL